LTHKTRQLESGEAEVPKTRSAPGDELVLISIGDPEANDSPPVAIILHLQAQLAESVVPLVMPDLTPVVAMKP
jgi:hypothetical protein